MMKVLAVCLVLSSLATAGICSAQPEMQKQQSVPVKKAREDVIVKKGQRLIVVEIEYEKEGLAISPHKPTDHIDDKSSSSTIGDRLSEAAITAKEKAKEAASVLPNLGQGLSTSTTESPPPPSDAHQSTPEDKAQGGTEHVSEKAKHYKENLKQIFLGGRVVSPENWAALMGVVRLLGFATAYGMSMWVTFVSSYVLAGALPRKQLGIVQSKIYPVYFRVMAYSIGLSLVGLWLSRGCRRPETVQGYNLLAALAMVLANLFYLEPHATKVMFERMKMEKVEDANIVTNTPPMPSQPRVAGTESTTSAGAAVDRGSARMLRSGAGAGAGSTTRGKTTVKFRLGVQNQRLKRFNNRSSLLNVLTLMALTWHLVDLGQRLHFTC